MNPRGIGWTHGSKKYLPRLERLRVKSTQNGNGYHPKGREYPEERAFILTQPDQDRLTFLANEAVKLIIAYFVFDAYRTFFGREYFQLCARFHSLLCSEKLQLGLECLGLRFHTSPEISAGIVRRFFLPPACWAACYAFVDGIRAVIALLAVGGLYLISPALAADPWMYPPTFGSWRYILWPRLKGKNSLSN